MAVFVMYFRRGDSASDPFNPPVHLFSAVAGTANDSTPLLLEVRDAWRDVGVSGKQRHHRTLSRGWGTYAGISAAEAQHHGAVSFCMSRLAVIVGNKLGRRIVLCLLGHLTVTANMGLER
jgi:hypothetical protein